MNTLTAHKSNDWFIIMLLLHIIPWMCYLDRWWLSSHSDVVWWCKLTLSFPHLIWSFHFPWQGCQLFRARIISPNLDLVNVLLNAIRDCGQSGAAWNWLYLTAMKDVVRTDGRAVYKVTLCRPWRATMLIYSVPVDKGVPCGSVSCAHTPAECQTL